MVETPLNSWHGGAGGEGYKARHQCVLNQVLPASVAKSLYFQKQVFHT